LASLQNTIYWINVKGPKQLATLNLIKGTKVLNEKLVKKDGQEYRIWNPFRSKLGAAIINGIEIMPITDTSKVLCIGITNCVTISHISDIVKNGKVFCVEPSVIKAQYLLNKVTSKRKNVITIKGDFRDPKNYSPKPEKVDVVYVDVPVTDKADIAILNCKEHLQSDGYCIMVIETSSISLTKEPSNENQENIRKFRSSSFEIIQEIPLINYHYTYSIIITKWENE